MPILSSRFWTLGLAVLVGYLAGCEPLTREALLVATSWSAADRSRIEEEFARWLESSARATFPVRWLILEPGNDLETLAARRRPPDVLLGGQIRSYDRLAGSKRLAPLPMEGSPDWAVARNEVIRVVMAPTGRIPATGPGVAFDDPRNDPISMAWAAAQLAGGFPEGYARLVRAAGVRRRVGRQAGSAIAALERRKVERAVGLVAVDRGNPESVPMTWPEGVAIVADGRHQDQARTFLEFLSQTGRARPLAPRTEEGSRGALELLADLLGATLVDAQDELWVAWAAMERNGSPAGPLRRLTEPPPWPPASIAKILDREGDQAMAMLEMLAGQIATDPASRAWLLSSWLSPPRPIDRRVLEEVTLAADGRLFREPRFRAWLRAEWTAWARQRYRRVVRAVENPRFD